MSDDARDRYALLHYGDLSTWSLAHTKASTSSELPPTVLFLTRRRDGQIGVLLSEPLDEEISRDLHGRVYAVAGTTAILTSIARGSLPRGLEMLVLRDGSAADIDVLAETDVLDRLTALAVLDDGLRTQALARLFARPLRALESLSIFDASDALVRALPETLLVRLKTLRFHGSVRRPTPVDLSRVLGGDRRAARTLDLAHLTLDAASQSAWLRGDWSELEHLLLNVCELEPSDLSGLRLPALRELRSTAYFPESPHGLGDATVASLVPTSPRLEIVSLEKTRAGDASALALAEHGRALRYLNLDGTRVGNAGAIALGASVAFDRLEYFHLDARLSFDAACALTESRVPAIRHDAERPYRGLATVLTWAPTPPPAETAPAPSTPHRFRWQHHEVCGACGGHIPWDGCPGHQELVIHPMTRGAEPPTPEARAWVATHGALMTQAEALGRQMLETMTAWGKHTGAPHVTWWVLDRAHRGHDRPPFEGPLGFDAIIEAVGRPPFSETASWAHACARARARNHPELPDPYTPARTIADLGISIVGLDPEDGLLLALRTS
ncbi:MAG: hypothetical protein J0L92_30125 [Deltaproteobacteria bacterium]|nr:hypothetical protein [Deltaproteobacteria bacterium]